MLTYDPLVVARRQQYYDRVVASGQANPGEPRPGPRSATIRRPLRPPHHPEEEATDQHDRQQAEEHAPDHAEGLTALLIPQLDLLRRMGGVVLRDRPGQDVALGGDDGLLMFARSQLD